jgi:hypothetical protein
MTYWCSHTQEVLGRDNKEAHPLKCQKGRDCHED